MWSLCGSYKSKRVCSTYSHTSIAVNSHVHLSLVWLSCRHAKCSYPSMRDSSDDEEQEEFEGATARIKAARKRAASGRKAFNTADVLVAVLGRSGTDGTKSSKGVLGHMPSHFPQEVVENWKQWAKNTPNSLGEIPRRCDGTRGRCGHHNTVVTRRRRRHATSASSDSPFAFPSGGAPTGASADNWWWR